MFDISQFFANFHKKSYGLFFVTEADVCTENKIDIYLKFDESEKEKFYSAVQCSDKGL